MKSKNITVRKLVELLNKEENMTGGASGKERILGLYINGNHFGYVTSAKLDGWGDGLVTDVYLELETEVSTNADRIRAMTNEELSEFIEKAKMCGALITRETTSVECCNCTDGFCKDVSEWLESEAETE